MPAGQCCDLIGSLSAAEAREEITKVTYGELRRDVALFAAAMRKMGIAPGDRVVGEYRASQPLAIG